MQLARRRFLASLTFVSALVCAPLTGCVAQAPAQGDLVGRVIVKFKDTATVPGSVDTLQQLERACGARASYVRAVGAHAHLYDLAGLRDQRALQQAVKTLNAHPSIEFAEIDRLMKPAATPGAPQ